MIVLLITDSSTEVWQGEANATDRRDSSAARPDNKTRMHGMPDLTKDQRPINSMQKSKKPSCS